MPVLFGFRSVAPRFRIAQEAAVRWLSRAHERAGGDVQALLRRHGCSPLHIAWRWHELPDYAFEFPGEEGERVIFHSRASPRGEGASRRAAFFAGAADRVFEELYPSGVEAPRHLIHVSCTGYVSPSAAQKLVARRAWQGRTAVTHAYHMGCYASVPAVRVGAGYLASDPSARIDLVHTELCTLHLDPTDHSPEQLVVQSLFADGFIGYRLAAAADEGEPGFELLGTREEVIPGTETLMTWSSCEHGLRMGLAKEVPQAIRGCVARFVDALAVDAGINPATLDSSATWFAIHPGGPRIIDAIREVLGLEEPRVAHGRKVLRERGNMSSATLPHVWEEMLSDEGIPPGSHVVSLAFGPGLTICGTVFRKV